MVFGTYATGIIPTLSALLHAMPHSPATLFDRFDSATSYP